VPGGAHLTRARGLCLAALWLGVVLPAGCTNRLQVPAPALTGDAEAVCASLRDAAPPTVAGQAQRAVSSDGVALAWGSPAIVLRCGTTEATEIAPGSPCQVVNGVDWFAEDVNGGYRFTTIGREVPIEVTVPHAYAPEADALVDLAPAVKAANPVRERCV